MICSDMGILLAAEAFEFGGFSVERGDGVFRPLRPVLPSLWLFILAEHAPALLVGYPVGSSDLAALAGEDDVIRLESLERLHTIVCGDALCDYPALWGAGHVEDPAAIIAEIERVHCIDLSKVT